MLRYQFKRYSGYSGDKCDYDLVACSWVGLCIILSKPKTTWKEFTTEIDLSKLKLNI
jgi:hypothetical protein